MKAVATDIVTLKAGSLEEIRTAIARARQMLAQLDDKNAVLRRLHEDDKAAVLAQLGRPVNMKEPKEAELVWSFPDEKWGAMHAALSQQSMLGTWANKLEAWTPQGRSRATRMKEANMALVEWRERMGKFVIHSQVAEKESTFIKFGIPWKPSLIEPYLDPAKRALLRLMSVHFSATIEEVRHVGRQARPGHVGVQLQLLGDTFGFGTKVQHVTGGLDTQRVQEFQ